MSEQGEVLDERDERDEHDELDVLAIGPHPDDVELGCGGTVALLACAGRRVGILNLTSGEAGTRGSVEERQAEARAAAAILGVTRVEFLALGDGGMRTGAAEEDAVIEVLRRLRPELVLGPAASDRHPDHGRAHRLVRDACFYSGLARRGAGTPHRPAACFSYMLHDPFEPAFLVDVSVCWELKMRALDAYTSQIRGGQAAAAPAAAPVAAGPATKVASREFRLMIEGRARHFGQLIGAEFAEPFSSRTPIAVSDPWELLPGGLR